VTALLKCSSDSDTVKKKFENRSISDEVKACKTKCASFWATLPRYRHMPLSYT